MYTSTALVVTALITAPTLFSVINWPNPVAGAPAHLAVTRVFDLPNGEYQAGHRGVDVRAPLGTELIAPISGTVHYSGELVDRGVLSIAVDEHTLLSFEPVTSDLQAGAAVEAGQSIGVVSAGSHCSASCLHIGVRVDGHYVNPLRYFLGGRPRLLPMTGDGQTPD